MKKELMEELYPDCPIRNIITRFSNKWAILILYSLEKQSPMRFNELRKNIADISQKMLTSNLRTLEEDGLIHRKIFAEIPPRVEYSLSKRGKSLIPHLNALILWAKEEMPGILSDRNKKSGDMA
ncbi:transcriptional regulator [Ornithobacterium rhinotracheale]|uniref:winged helix-turn-helix transcriptional regulator n=1 Tax=Ornithobacterium rhinotracheale TaxID=28251 RepID=UPI00129CBFEC|nr:helix-turn-helix domain-containing protein [Ornithobacterium rhinotracheale]MRJ10342.1 transcriptional regulator [Ornithobacterium rhinotracheale]